MSPQTPTLKVNPTVREGCLTTFGSLMSSGLLGGDGILSSLVRTLVKALVKFEHNAVNNR